MKDYILDLNKYVLSTGYFDKIKIAGSKQSTVIEALDKEKEVVLKGSFTKAIDELDGDFGLSNLNLLGHITSDSEFNSKDSTLEVTYEDKNGQRVPRDLTYCNKSKSYINYRFMGQSLIPDQPKFIEPAWDVVIKPSRSNVQQFGWASAGLGAYEQYFIPKIKDGQLRFYIGEEGSANQRGGVVFASELQEDFDAKHKWKINQIMTALKLSETCDCEMSFSIKGVIQITLSTGLGVYRYIFPAKVR